MAATARRTLVLLFIGITAAVAVVANAEVRAHDKLGMKLHTVDITPKGIPTRVKLDFNADAIPKEVRGKFPSFDGDSFNLNIPPRVATQVTASQVLAQTLAPLLKAMGYGSRLDEILPAKNAPEGSALPRANLSALATETCREVEGERYQRFHAVCAAMRGKKSNEIADRVFQLAYGMTFPQFVADVERQRILYVFRQTPRGVPIEHAGVIAARWEGESITSIHGTVFNRYEIANDRKLSPGKALDVGQKNLFKYLELNEGKARSKYSPKETPVLVLLPYGGARAASGEEVAALRYAYRTLLFARVNSRQTRQPDNLSWMAWI
ncbi:MAG TPA: hypothetical protein VGK04_04020, partial [Thermoanaerobaculia bacterium]